MTPEEKHARRQQELIRLDQWLLKLHREHPWYALGIAFGSAITLAGLAELMKFVVKAVAHLVMR